MLGSTAHLSIFFEDWAFLLDQERSSMLPTMAAGLLSLVHNRFMNFYCYLIWNTVSQPYCTYQDSKGALQSSVHSLHISLLLCLFMPRIKLSDCAKSEIIFPLILLNIHLIESVSDESLRF
jgi:hypothetical protein